MPPSTIYTPPVQKLLSSLARNNIMRATSSGGTIALERNARGRTPLDLLDRDRPTSG
jgi:hypothetical protein